MCWLEKVHEFVNDDVFDLFLWLFGEFRIETNRTGRSVATSPFRLHLLDKELLEFDIENWRPVTDERRYYRFQYLSVPLGHQLFLHLR